MTWRRPHGWVIVLIILVSATWVVLTETRKSAELTALPDELRYTSVHVAPGAERIFDAERARRIIGDRPIAVIVGERTGMCADFADILPGVIVLWVNDVPRMPIKTCDGGSPYYERNLTATAREAVTLLDTDHDWTVHVEEYVRAFDAHVAETFPGTPPPARGPPRPANDGAVEKIVLVMSAAMGVVLLVVVAFLVREVWSLAEYVLRRRRDWRARTNARLNRLADRVLRLTEPGSTSTRRAATAKGYVLLLQAFESATNEAQRFAVDEQLRELEWQAGIPLPEDRAARRPPAP
ncbi:hypothetical protein [Actinophytocola sp.]|uniref:hypothetical protein n=1 Tax=Actinophytocola sp. TaxID=1872138 RepID=UPI002ED47C63